MIRVGQRAPALSGKDQTGKMVSLSDFKGKIVVLYFYPKDDTPGCTIEACSFRDAYSEIKDTGAVILGVSVDNAQSHQRFIKKHSLPFSLIADTTKNIVHSYGVWGEKSFMGRRYLGTNRVTFIIDGKGIVRHTFEKVKPLGHAKEVLETIQHLSSKLN